MATAAPTTPRHAAALLLALLAAPGCLFVSGRPILGRADALDAPDARPEAGPEAGPPCDGGQTCGEACVNLESDPAHCGACGRACTPPPSATAMCVAGSCGWLCVAGRGDCDGDRGNGCETSLADDPAHCGRCGNRCAPMGDQAPACRGGRCAAPCPAGRGDCDGDVANGCERDLATDAAHCGRCGNTCTAGPNQVATCAGGRCGSACRTGYSDCNAISDDGCETLGPCL